MVLGTSLCLFLFVGLIQKHLTSCRFPSRIGEHNHPSSSTLATRIMAYARNISEEMPPIIPFRRLRDIRQRLLQSI
ncbi:hypothetical protein F5146DRAFT_317930 [Armillaria mellea]|nr:hypothetical protein F5146DRAFT_317930 [Armillaria mellea]